jgi:hypothetical protein
MAMARTVGIDHDHHRRAVGDDRPGRTGIGHHRRTVGIFCYVLAGLMLAAALVVPVVGFFATMMLAVWAAAASGMTMAGDVTIGMTMAGPGHDPAGVAIELIAELVFGLLRLLGPLPAILVAVLTVIVEIGLIIGAILLILIGRRLRRPARVR